MDYQQQADLYKQRADEAVLQFLEKTEGHAETLAESMHYALIAPGKRVRPQLLFAASDALPLRQGRASAQIIDRLAAAVEMVHTYSLVHDDLPCMDNDELRRGRPTNHVKFGEANALLTGDALLNLGFEVLLDAIDAAETSDETKHVLLAARLMGRRFGQQGMIGGQVIDLASEGESISLEVLEELVLKKTSALIEAAVLGGAAAAAATEAELECFRLFANKLGLAFQIRDDILDSSSNTETMGKTIGKDVRDNKSTYVTILGLENAMKRAEDATSEAISALAELDKMGCNTLFLRDFAKALLERKK